MSLETYLLVTLGCFRNETDSDGIRSAMARMAFEETGCAESAGIIIVNTCGFIAEACAEGIDTILEIDRLISAYFRNVSTSTDSTSGLYESEVRQ